MPLPPQDSLEKREGIALMRALMAHCEIDPVTNCWRWARSLNHNGYAETSIRGFKTRRVHRVTYELVKGPIPDGYQIDHLCRVRCCINPDHLEAVTREENIARGNAPHILHAKQTHCKRGHEFTPENTYILNRGAPARQVRACRQCRIDARGTPLERQHRPPLTDEQKAEIKRLRAGGMIYTEIAAVVGVCRQSALDAVNGRQKRSGNTKP